MKILITENQLKTILLEYNVAPFKEVTRANHNGPLDRLDYRFELNGLIYNVLFKKVSGRNVFDVSFDYNADSSITKGTHGIYGANKDIRHLNSVLYTVMNIVEDAVKKYKIRMIEFEGGRERGEHLLQKTTRSKIYQRFIDQKFHPDAIEHKGNYTYVDMTKAYPEVFENESMSKIDELFGMIRQFIYPNELEQEDEKNSLSYVDDKMFTIYLNDLEMPNDDDYVELLEIGVDDYNKEYSLTIEMIRESLNVNMNFSSYESLRLGLSKWYRKWMEVSKYDPDGDGWDVD
jgi:hypothetical protein